MAGNDRPLDGPSNNRPTEYGEYLYDRNAEISRHTVRNWRRTGRYPIGLLPVLNRPRRIVIGLKYRLAYDMYITDKNYLYECPLMHASILKFPKDRPDWNQDAAEPRNDDGEINNANNPVTGLRHVQIGRENFVTSADETRGVRQDCPEYFSENSVPNVDLNMELRADDEPGVRQDERLGEVSDEICFSDDSVDSDGEARRDIGEEYEHLIHQDGDIDHVEEMDVDQSYGTLEIYDSCRINRCQSQLLILAKVLRFNNCDRDLEFLLKLIDIHLPADEYKSKYLYLKNFPQPSTTYYYFCDDCDVIVDFGAQLSAECELCHTMYRVKDLKKKNQFFVYMSLKEQLMSVLGSSLAQHLRRECSESDLVNAMLYKGLRKLKTVGENDISLSANTDGVVPFQHTQKKLWPILVTINELPPRLRQNNVLPVAMWFGDKKPPMNLYLKPFVDELQELQINGFICRMFGQENEILVKAHLVMICADTPAKADILNKSHHRGEYPCPHCLIQGKTVAVGKGHARVFCGGLGTLRKQKMYYDDVVKAVQDRQPVNGYYGHTVISRLATMDMANSCPPEYMHCVLLGQVLSCLEAWFDSKNKKQPFYLGPKRAEFDRRMTAIRPPSEITRLPAKIGKDNKASQLKHILLYYSLPCLYGLMKDDYYNHWFLLVYGITLLLQDEVSTQDLDSAQKALEKFVQGIELLYGEAYMKYNTHLLLHVTNYARYFGGLWAWSAFPYETFNGVLAKLYHGSQHVAEQICKMSCRIRYIKNAAHVFDSESCDPAATRLFLELTTSSRLHRIIEHRHDLKVCGAGKGFQITTPFLRTLIENVVKFPISELSQSYERFIYKKKVFTTALYTRATLRTNHFVSMENGDCVKIMHLLCIKNAVSEEKEYVLLGIRLFDLGKSLCAHESFDARKIFTIVSETQDHVCYVYKSIKHKLVRIEMDNGDLCLVKIVNSIETD